MKKMKEIKRHNYITSSGFAYGSGSGSDFLTSSGSDSTSQKVTVPTVPVPVPVPQRWFKRCLSIMQGKTLNST
jgi:hypothetical protein